MNSTGSGFLASFRPDRMPLMTRVSYLHELRSWGPLHLMIGGLQAGTIAVFIKKTFTDLPDVDAELLNLAVGLVAAARAIGHLTSFYWASYGRSKPPINIIVRLQIATALAVAAIGLSPATSTGLWMTVGLSMVAWTTWSGFITLRSGVWRANYQAADRPRIAGKLSTLEAVTIAVTGLVLGSSLDRNPSVYQILFPVLAICGVVGAWCYRRIPLRRTATTATSNPQTTNPQAKHQPAPKPASLGLQTIWHVLRDDPDYRGYMCCMFLMGFGNLMLSPVLAIVLASLFSANYLTSIGITTILPLICMIFAIPVWGRLLERRHVTSFRAVHAWCFVAVAAACVCGVAQRQLGFLYLAAIAQGIGWGGGVLAWNLGHQHFSPAEREAEYMAVHVTLTGIRGVIGPLLGVQLYNFTAGSGWQVGAFLVCLCTTTCGALGFGLLSRNLRHRKLAMQ